MQRDLTREIFPGGNTPLGFYSFFAEGLQGLERIVILKGGPGTGKSTLLRGLCSRALERGLAAELWRCSGDGKSLDGVILPALSMAVIDGTAPHTVDPVYPGAVE